MDLIRILTISVVSGYNAGPLTVVSGYNAGPLTVSLICGYNAEPYQVTDCKFGLWIQ